MFLDKNNKKVEINKQINKLTYCIQLHKYKFK